MSVQRTIEALYEADPDAAEMLVMFAAYDTLCEIVNDNRDEIMADLTADVIAKNSAVRREIVREFIDARLNQQDVDPLIAAAIHATVLDGEIAKAVTQGGKKKKRERKAEEQAMRDWWKKEKRGPDGRWAEGFGARQADAMLDPIRALSQSDTRNAQWAGTGRQWNEADKYEKARRVGGLLSSSNSQTAQAAGLLTSGYGIFGAEAEEVLGRSMRRAAYRYRGTERRPDPGLRTGVAYSSKALNNLRTAKTQEDQQKARDDLAASAQRGSPWAKITEYQLGNRGITPDQRSMNISADVATDYLLKKVPNIKNAELSIKAGKVPPSQGVLIDRDGDMVSQAVGFNGDHYIPFDLKNLKRLHGGQYVRTRVYGGPTTEDIYTGLLTGARQMTVASNSGVFTVEFDPDLRGGRRYNDKAHQMVKRYEEILDAVKERKVTLGSISAETKQKIKEQALDEAQQDPVQAKINYDRLIREEQERQEFNFEVDEDALGTQAHTNALAEARRGGPDSMQAIARNARQEHADLRSKAYDDRYRKIQLDGEGYHRALLALQEEFPYYIRSVRRDTIEEFTNARGLNDKDDLTSRTYRGTDHAAVNTKAKQLVYGDKMDAKADKEKPDEEGETETGGGSTGNGRTPKATAKIGRTEIPLVEKTEPLAKATLPLHTRNELSDSLEKFGRLSGAYHPSAAGRQSDTLKTVIGDGLHLAWYISKQGSDFDPLLKEIDALSPADRATLHRTSQELGKKALDPNMNLSDSDKKDVADTESVFSQYLAIKQPFSAATDVTVPTKDKLPIASPGIVALGQMKKNYEVAQRIIERNDPKLAAEIRKYQSDPAKALKDMERLCEDYEVEDQPRIKEPIKKDLERLHEAWAFAHASALAWGEEPGKAPAPAAGAAPAGSQQPPLGFAGQKKTVGKSDRPRLHPDSFYGRHLARARELV